MKKILIENFDFLLYIWLKHRIIICDTYENNILMKILYLTRSRFVGYNFISGSIRSIQNIQPLNFIEQNKQGVR